MKDFAKSIRTGNSLSMPKTKYDDEIHRLEVEYMKREDVSTPEKAIKELDRKDKINKRIQELKELQRKEWGKIGNSKVGNSQDYNISALRSMVSRALSYNETGALQDAEAVLEDARYEREDRKEEAKRELEKCENELREIEKLYSQINSAFRKLK